MSRVDRVMQAFKKEMSNIIHHKLKDPRIGFITVTRVELTKDLRFAKIYYSVLGGSSEKENTSAALENANGFIRRLIAQRLNLRFAPEIVFKEDNSPEYSIHLQEELDKLIKPHEPKKGSQRDQ